MTPAPFHRYQLHGLVVESTIEFPELPSLTTPGPADVLIDVGQTPARLDNPFKSGGCYQVDRETFLIWLEGQARFLVSNGRSIRVEPEIGADEAEVRRLLLSSPLAALLLQRGTTPFHASAVSIDGAGVVFLGGPCAGKSTLAARFLAQGFRILADDISVVHFDEGGQPWIMPGYPELKLWPDSLAALALDGAALPRIRANSEKRILRFPERFDPSPVPVRAVYLLEPGCGPDAGITRIEGSARGAALLNHTYRPEFIGGAERRKTHCIQIARLANMTRFMKLGLAEGRFADEELTRAIVEDCRR